MVNEECYASLAFTSVYPFVFRAERIILVRSPLSAEDFDWAQAWSIMLRPYTIDYIQCWYLPIGKYGRLAISLQFNF